MTLNSMNDLELYQSLTFDLDMLDKMRNSTIRRQGNQKQPDQNRDKNKMPLKTICY